MSAVSSATTAACSASSPLVLFVGALLSNLTAETEAERKRRAQESQKSGPLSEYDYVVVGGGTAGSVLAARLSENASVSVLLLERGGHEPEENKVPAYTIFKVQSALSETLMAQPEPQNCNGTGCPLNLPNVLGGGSAINGMLYVRGSSADYDEWARLTKDQGWSYKSVLPYFKKSEANLDPLINKDTYYHGRVGPQKVSWEPYRHPVMPLIQKAFAATGVPARLDINAESQLGNSVVQTTSAGGERWTTYRSYVEPVLQKRSNLRVETFATARKVLLKKAGGGLQAVGVEYVDPRGKVATVRAKREVVLTAGALRTPQLLMVSGIGPASQLKAAGIPVLKDLPVGEELHDHPDVSGVPYKCASPLSCATDWESRLQDLRQYKQNRTGPLSALNILHMTAFARSTLAKPGTGQQPDVQIMFLGSAKEYEACLPLDTWRLNKVVPLIDVVRPLSTGWVRLNTTNPFGQPLVKLNYYGDAAGHDLAVAVEGLRMVLRLQETLAPLGLVLDTDGLSQCLALGGVQSDAFLRCVARTRTSTTWHWSGTCKMGHAGDARAVLDSRLRVRGVSGLRVCDASAMPFIPSGNTNNPVIMLAERAADLIKQDQA